MPPIEDWISKLLHPAFQKTHLRDMRYVNGEKDLRLDGFGGGRMLLLGFNPQNLSLPLVYGTMEDGCAEVQMLTFT